MIGPVRPIDLEDTENPSRSFGARRLVLALSLAASACQGATGHVDLIGASIERSAEELRSRRGHEAEVEIHSGESGPWTVVIVPFTGVDYEVLVRSGLKQEAIDRLMAETPRMLDGQCIVQIRKDTVLIRPLAFDLVRVDKQFVLSGRETTRVVAELKGAAQDGKPTLVDVFTKEP